ncbi:hypothetical protein ACE1BM_20875, partial [Aeromonas jandaei]
QNYLQAPALWLGFFISVSLWFQAQPTIPHRLLCHIPLSVNDPLSLFSLNSNSTNYYPGPYPVSSAGE